MKITPAGLRPAFLLRRMISYIQGKRAQRKTLAMPSILTQYPRAADYILPKPTASNLRKFAETPIARKAINTIKDRVAGMQWKPQPKAGSDVGTGARRDDPRIALLTANLDSPNHDDSFRSLCEQVVEDVIVGGFGAIELELTEDEQHPVNLYPVDGATIRMRADWDGKPDSPRYTQVTGKVG